MSGNKPVSSSVETPINPSVVYYDYNHCKEFLEPHAKQLRENKTGLEALAIYRALYYSFTVEALETNSFTLGQWDRGIAILFLPRAALNIDESNNFSSLSIATAKALELIQAEEPPIVIDLPAAISMQPKINERSLMKNWMTDEFYSQIIAPQQVEIRMYFNGFSFFKDMIEPQLLSNGFNITEDYVKMAQSGYIKVRHPASPGKIYKLPWLLWIREMLVGGYSIVYSIACMGNYIKKILDSFSTKNPLTDRN